MNFILKKPIFSEKSMRFSTIGMYTFIVDKKFNKPAIAKIVEQKFGVNVISVKTANYKDKAKVQKSRKGRFTVPGFKKAIIQLKTGQTIALFESQQAVEETPTKKTKQTKNLLKGTKVKIEKISKDTSKKAQAVTMEGEEI